MYKPTTIMASPRFSISYYKSRTEIAYVDSRMYATATDASVRAVYHLGSHPDLVGAAIIYQGRQERKRVRTLQLFNHFPNIS